MNAGSRDAVRRRASGLCEYCRIPEGVLTGTHHVEHVVPAFHGGGDESANLALSCGRCNLLKGTNLAGLDPADGTLTRLFHPRADDWSEHFRFDGAVVVGKTDVGRTTIAVLRMNSDGRVLKRDRLLSIGYRFSTGRP